MASSRVSAALVPFAGSGDMSDRITSNVLTRDITEFESSMAGSVNLAEISLFRVSAALHFFHEANEANDLTFFFARPDLTLVSPEHLRSTKRRTIMWGSSES